MKLERRVGQAQFTPQGPHGPIEGFPLSSEYTSFQMGGDVLLFKQQNKISCESPTCDAGEKRAAVAAEARLRATRGAGFKRSLWPWPI